MSDIAKLEHIIYIIRQYEENAVRLSKLHSSRMQMYMMSESDCDREVPEEPMTIQDQATEILGRIEGTLENKE